MRYRTTRSAVYACDGRSCPQSRRTSRRSRHIATGRPGPATPGPWRTSGRRTHRASAASQDNPRTVSPGRTRPGTQRTRRGSPSPRVQQACPESTALRWRPNFQYRHRWSGTGRTWPSRPGRRDAGTPGCRGCRDAGMPGCRDAGMPGCEDVDDSDAAGEPHRSHPASRARRRISGRARRSGSAVESSTAVAAACRRALRHRSPSRPSPREPAGSPGRRWELTTSRPVTL